MEQLIDMVVVSFERTKTHAMPQCVESGSAYGFMQRVSVAMAGVVPLLSRFTCAHLRQVLSVSTLCLFSVSVGVQLVCNFVPAQIMQRVSVAMAGVVLSVSARVRGHGWRRAAAFPLHRCSSTSSAVREHAVFVLCVSWCATCV